MSLSPTEAAILAAFGASAITGAVTFSITVYSARRQRDRDEQQRQHERERDADERANRLADERRDRLRGGYQAIVYAASTMHAVAKELQAIWANEPVEVRNERLNAVLQDATGDLGRAVASLALDDGTASVIEGLAAIRGDSPVTWCRSSSSIGATPARPTRDARRSPCSDRSRRSRARSSGSPDHTSRRSRLAGSRAHRDLVERRRLVELVTAAGAGRHVEQHEADHGFAARAQHLLDAHHEATRCRRRCALDRQVPLQYVPAPVTSCPHPSAHGLGSARASRRASASACRSS